MILAVRFFPLLVSLLFLLGCEEKRPPGPELVELKGASMGTSYSLKYLAGASAPKAGAMQKLVDQLLAQIEGKMSTYQETSELSRFNSNHKKTSFHFSPETMTVIAEGLRVGALSEGALDITVGPLVELWGFGKATRHGLPSSAAIQRAKAHIGLSKIRMDQGEVRVMDPLLQLDLSAVAKGYAVDEVAGLLEVFGFMNYMVEVGGEIKVKGNKGDKPWRIGIERPDPQGRSLYLGLALSNVGMATSGDYRNFFEVGGKRYSHTMDPQKGKPVTHTLASATVIASSCMTADAWATAMMVLGAQKGLELAKSQKLAVYLLYWEGAELKEAHSPAFAPYLPQETKKDKNE